MNLRDKSNYISSFSAMGRPSHDRRSTVIRGQSLIDTFPWQLIYDLGEGVHWERIFACSAAFVEKMSLLSSKPDVTPKENIKELGSNHIQSSTSSENADASSSSQKASNLALGDDDKTSEYLVLDDLYNSSLEKGMIFLTRVISLGNKDTFAFDLENWIKAVNYQPIEAFAIILKKDGCYEESFAFYNQLYKLRPSFSLIHYNAMKVLAASGQFQKAYRAIQLWCLANIPEKASIRALEVPLEAIPKLGKDITEFDSLDPCNISMWSFAVPDAMYHLGTLHTIVSGKMAEADKRAYVASVSGNGGRPTHDIKAATELGELLVERLPWNVVYAEAKGEFWAWLKAYSMSLYSFGHHAAAQHANQ